MKKGLLVALFGLALVATLALPQTASAATPWPNTAQIDSFTTASGTVGVVISSTATVWVLSSATLAITKLVDNLDRPGGPMSQVDAISGEVVMYIVELVNGGEDEIISVNFSDTIPSGLSFCDTASAIPGCVDPQWVSAALADSGPLRFIPGPPEMIEDEPSMPIRVSGGGPANSTILTYTAVVN